MISVVVAFFTRALRTSIAVVAAMGFYLPYFNSNRGATIGLTLSGITTTVWYLLATVETPTKIDATRDVATTALSTGFMCCINTGNA